MAGKVKIDWNSRAVMNAFSQMTQAEEREAARRVHAKALHYVPVLNRRQRKWGLYFKVKRKTINDPWKFKIPGALRRSIKLWRSRFLNGGWIVWAGDFVAWYAKIVEYGTKMRRQRKTGRFVGKMPAAKYMRKALTAEKRRFIYRLKKNLNAS